MGVVILGQRVDRLSSTILICFQPFFSWPTPPFPPGLPLRVPLRRPRSSVNVLRIMQRVRPRRHVIVSCASWLHVKAHALAHVHRVNLMSLAHFVADSALHVARHARPAQWQGVTRSQWNYNAVIGIAPRALFAPVT